MINNVTLTGRLTKDPELKYSQNGTAFANATLAVERNFTNAQGERETDFIRLTASGKRAETFANYFKKGELVGVEGSIRTRNYEDQSGQKVYITEVAIDKTHFLQSKKDKQQNSYTNNADPFAGAQQVDVTDADLPF